MAPMTLEDLDALEDMGVPLDELPADLEAWCCDCCGELFSTQREADACEAMHYGRN